MPPTWVIFPAGVGVGALYFAFLALVFRSKGLPLPIPEWWQRVPAFQQRLAYLAIAWQLVAAEVLLWSIEPGHELPEAIRIIRGLGSLLAWGVLIWVAVTALRGTRRL